MRTCPACKQVKPLTDFYKDSRAKSGVTTYCKICILAGQKAAYAADPDKFKKRIEVQRQKRLLEDPDKERARWIRNVNRYPEKRKARFTLHNAVVSGAITRPKVCSNCNTICTPDGHHEDYSKPLEVIWLCRQCHTQLHNERNTN